MEKLISDIMSKVSEFKADADKCAKGNCAAGMRSRKAARELRDLLKQWAKASMVPVGK